MKSRIHNPLLQALFLFAVLLQGAQASDNERFLLSDSEGFVTTLPNVSTVTVTQHLIEMQQDLASTVDLLKQEVKRKSFKTFDTLVTVVMPGGLIYAKLRHDSHKRSQHRLLSATEKLENISDELFAFQTERDDFLIATID